jgi:hypothetical protein
VEWFNAVDATYRSDVRAIADAQSARIDAQMGQIRAELLRWMFLFWVGTVGAILAMTKL